jgi:hypothetical protein
MASLRRAARVGTIRASTSPGDSGPDPWTAGRHRALIALRARMRAVLDTVTARPDLVEDARAQYALGHQPYWSKTSPMPRRPTATLTMSDDGRAMNDLGALLMG